MNKLTSYKRPGTKASRPQDWARGQAPTPAPVDEPRCTPGHPHSVRAKPGCWAHTPFPGNPVCHDDPLGVTKKTEPHRAPGEAGGPRAAARIHPQQDRGAGGPTAFGCPDVFARLEEDCTQCTEN